MDFKESTVSRFELSSGARLLIVPFQDRKALTIGFWVLTGSAYENPDFLGLSHFAEHILFKGSKNFSGQQIVSEIERKGGNIDAYTTRQETCYYATVLGEDVETAVKILADLVSHPLMRDEDIELERQVILSEIDEVWDEPEALAQEVFALLLFGNSPLGRPIIGTQKTVSRIGRSQLHDYWRTHYVGQNILVGASGAVEPADFAALVDKYLKIPKDLPEFPDTSQVDSKFDGKLVIIPRVSSQVHFFIGSRTFPYRDERRYVLALLDTILGRGSASRLFQIIREKLGLVYNITSFGEYYSDNGLWATYAAASRSNFPKLLIEILKQFNDIAINLVDENEISNAKSFLRGRLLLSSESLWNVLGRAIESERHLGRFVSLEETAQKVMEVTVEEIRELANEIFSPQNIVALAFGDVDEIELPLTELETVVATVEEICPDNFSFS